MAVIEQPPDRAYVAPMRSVVVRLFTLVAILLMPLGMSAAPAAIHHRDMAASMAMQHCPDGNSKSAARGFAECTMGCSAALPAAELPRAQPPRIVSTPVAPSASQVLTGLHPDTATPPPKVS